MGDKEKTTVMLEEYLAILPENIHIPGDVSEAMRFEFVDSATSHLERLGQEIAAFETGQSQQGDFVTTARTILHNIKGEAGIMDIAEISDVCRLTESLLDEDYGTVPVDTLLSVKAWLFEAVQQVTSVGSGLPACIFSAESMKIIGSAEIDLLDLGFGTSDAQAVEGVSCAMRQVAELAARMARPDVKALAGKALKLLGEIQRSEQCVISDDHKESLFDLLDAMKERVSNADKTGIKFAVEKTISQDDD